MPKPAIRVLVTAVLACLPASELRAERRELAKPVDHALALADGREVACTIHAWSEVGLEGSCGSRRWSELAAPSAFATLKAIVPDKDPAAAIDAVEAMWTTAIDGRLETVVVDWARRAGAERSAIDQAKVEGRRIRAEQAELRRAELAKERMKVDPEAGVLSSKPWMKLSPDEFEAATSEALESARALLARAGGSATVHQTQRITLLAESGDPVHREDAAFLDRLAEGWIADLEAAGRPVEAQGRIPVILVSDRDRWRLLVTSAFGGDPAQHPDEVTVYPDDRAIALVAPQSDRTKFRAAAATALARALLHYAVRPDRGPAWVVEGLPRVLADAAVPSGGVDAAMRRLALPAIRSGGLATVLASGYGEGAWRQDRARAIAVSYVFTRWLFERDAPALARFARLAPTAPASPNTPDEDAARYRAAFGETLAQSIARAERWFQTND